MKSMKTKFRSMITMSNQQPLSDLKVHERSLV